MVSKPFDTIVVDCEGCLVKEFEKNPDLFKHITQIQVERDDNGSYDNNIAFDRGLGKIYGPGSVFIDPSAKSDQ